MLGSEIREWRATAKRQRTPVHLILFVTDQCNAKCVTCFYWENLNQGESLQPEHIENISRSLGRLLWLDISGGEPFLRKDLAWVCHKFIDDNGAPRGEKYFTFYTPPVVNPALGIRRSYIAESRRAQTQYSRDFAQSRLPRESTGTS